MTQSTPPPPGSGSKDFQDIRIVGMDIAVCRLAMPYPVQLGSIVYPTRDYVALRIRTDADIEGYALGYTRGTPLVRAIELLAPEVLERDARMIRSIIVALKRAHAPAWGAFVRAVSLLDIALWDIAAKAAKLPLYKLLGGYRDTIPVMAVAGYYLDRRTVEDVEEEILQRAQEGFKSIKIGIPALDSRKDAAFVARLRDALDDSVDLGIDAHSAWTEFDTALSTCHKVDSLGLSFIEDPCGPQHWRLMTELQARIRTPLAAGEEASMVEQHRDLLAGITILRVDATANGGLTDIMAVIHMAAVDGRRVSPHVFAPLHCHLAAAFPNVPLVEIIPPEVGADPLGRLLKSEPTIRDGSLVMDNRVGNGIDLDWESVVSHASSTIAIAG